MRNLLMSCFMVLTGFKEGWFKDNVWYDELPGFNGKQSLIDSPLSVLNIYPNPASNLLNFSEEVITATIYSMDGKMLLQNKNVSALKVSGLPKGLYILVTTDQKGQQSQFKWIKN